MSPADDSQLLIALGHPLRRDILRQIHQKDSISPKELSTTMGVHLSKISYHVRKLAECEAITLVRTKPVRGSTQHFYRFDIDEDWALKVLGLSVS